MQSMLTTEIRATALAFLTCGLASAQAHAPALAAPPGATLASRGLGLDRVDGLLRASAPSYKAEFAPEGPVFVAPLGPDAPRTLPWRFELESIRVGGTPLALDLGAAPEREGWSVVYDRGAALERYDVLSQGLEQSFVLHSLPNRDGALVVRGRIATELAPPAAGAHGGGLSFRAPLGGGVEIGAVRGIDADGRVVQGGIRWDGAALELSLPADFVAGARLPLVLDPLIGSSTTVYGDADAGDPDVAYDESSAQYLVVFERQWSGTDYDVYGQRVSAAGAPVGALILFETSIANLALNPSVGGINLTNAWFVAWQQGTSPFGPWDIYGRGVTSAGVLGAAIPIQTGIASKIEPSVATNRTTTSSSVPLAWQIVGGGGINTAGVSVSAAGVATLGITADAVLEADAAHASLGKLASTSPAGVTTVPLVWDRGDFSPVGGPGAMLLDMSGSPVTPVQTPLSPFFVNGLYPRIEGDGAGYFLAYTGGLFSSSIAGARLHLGAGSTLVADAAPTTLAGGTPKAREPALAWLGPKVAASWTQQVVDLNDDIALRYLDPADGSFADASATPLGVGPGPAGRSAIASERSGTATLTAASPDRALVVWESSGAALPFDGDILCQVVEAVGTGGSVVPAGGGCGLGGTIGFTGPAAIGNPSCAVTLTGADPAAPIAILNNVLGAPPLTCGACVWEPFSGLIHVKALVGGNAQQAFAMPLDPGLIGAVLSYQWTVVLGASTPCPLQAGVSLSNRMNVTVGE